MLDCVLCGGRPSGTATAVRSNVKEFAHESFDVWRCGSCASLHSSEVSGSLDRYYERYPMKAQRADVFARAAFARRTRWLREVGLRRSSRVLDYGCGVGLYVEHLRRLGYDATGFDPHVDAYSDPRVLDRTYDVVTSQDVLEHVEDPGALFAELVQRLAPAGVLHIGTPRADGIDVANDPAHPSLHQPYHRHILSERALTDLAALHGLETVALRRRWYFDSPLLPGGNQRFLYGYAKRMGGVIDVWFDPPRPLAVLGSPALLFDFFFGYFRASARGERASEMAIFLRSMRA